MRRMLSNSVLATEALSTIRAAIGLPGKYLYSNAQAVAQAHELLGILMFAATCVCPYSTDADGARRRGTTKLKKHHRNDP